ncbi:uncharacterized protein TRIREDRAFT_111674 [Trichoderma reesei QM6a]|uniref:Predicted protein n=2 Tax=Hypocrea jecorina TaxID=51453 RepID=G0RV48_HYPJQ|nr:uncharacterized protein TRIREDRAFT_111674 [Trichoderma reesei QM6a]EGR44985.1 predicted protein [Trichoderma reesei QM6a]ETR97932.1 hypothetical protein M419DRAFT_133991 [Trichoderma reesei RUT C-30]
MALCASCQYSTSKSVDTTFKDTMLTIEEAVSARFVECFQPLDAISTMRNRIPSILARQPVQSEARGGHRQAIQNYLTLLLGSQEPSPPPPPRNWPRRTSGTMSSPGPTSKKGVAHPTTTTCPESHHATRSQRRCRLATA